MTESTVFYRRKVTVSELVIMFAVRVKKGVVRFPLLANKVRTELSCVFVGGVFYVLTPEGIAETLQQGMYRELRINCPQGS
jgi:hypothetical protein